MEEGSSKSDDVFKSLNLNPQHFVDEVFVTIDQLLNDAFSYYSQEALTLVKADNPKKSEDLNRGVAQIRDTFQTFLDKKLSNWELFCLHKCFDVPDWFSLPNADEAFDTSSIPIDGNSDPDLDAQLDSLRTKIAEVGKETALLSGEFKEIQKESILISQVAGNLNETLQLYEQNSVIFQDLVKTGEQLMSKIEQQQKQNMTEDEQMEWKIVTNPNIDLMMSNIKEGLADAKLEDLKEFLVHIKNM